MKRNVFVSMLVALSVLCMTSCDQLQLGEEEGKEEQKGPQVTTLDAVQGSFNQVTLTGRVSGLERAAFDFECGIEYSTSNSFDKNNTTRIRADKSYSEDAYTIPVSNIHAGQTYYYRAYYINQQLDYYGEIKSFSFTWNAPEVITLNAELRENRLGENYVLFTSISKGFKDLTDQERQYFGVQISTTADFDEDKTIELRCDYFILSGDTIQSGLGFHHDRPGYLRFGTLYYYRAYFKLDNIISYGEAQTFSFDWRGPQMIDLGLSVKWADCNLGGYYMRAFGDYFAWGEIEPYYEPGYSESFHPVWKTGKSEGHAWSSYKYCNGSETTLTKYCNISSYGYNGFTDNNTTLLPQDDAAQAIWGGNWRIPTIQEFQELIDNCTLTWVEDDNIYLYGCTVTSNKPGYEDCSIFLPWHGLYGLYCAYWSSSLDTDNPTNALGVYFSPSEFITTKYPRISEVYIRPVCP